MDGTQNKHKCIIYALQFAIILDTLFLSIMVFSNDPSYWSGSALNILTCLRDILQEWKTLVSSLTAIGVAYFAFHLSLKKFRSEKWWLMKVEAYQRIIEALHHAKQFSGEHLDAEIEGKTISDKRKKELSLLTKKSNKEISKAIDLGVFLISEEALKRLQSYTIVEIRAADWVTYLETDYNTTQRCLDDMIAIAKKDLKRI